MRNHTIFRIYDCWERLTLRTFFSLEETYQVRQMLLIGLDTHLLLVKKLHIQRLNKARAIHFRNLIFLFWKLNIWCVLFFFLIIYMVCTCASMTFIFCSSQLKCTRIYEIHYSNRADSADKKALKGPFSYLGAVIRSIIHNSSFLKKVK